MCFRRFFLRSQSANSCNADQNARGCKCAFRTCMPTQQHSSSNILQSPRLLSASRRTRLPSTSRHPRQTPASRSSCQTSANKRPRQASTSHQTSAFHPSSVRPKSQTPIRTGGSKCVDFFKSFNEFGQSTQLKLSQEKPRNRIIQDV